MNAGFVSLSVACPACADLAVGARLVLEAADRVRVGGAFSNRTVSDFVTVSGADTTVASENFQAVEGDLAYGTHKVEETGRWLLAEAEWGKNPHCRDADTNFMGLMGVFAYNVLAPNSALVHSIRPAFRIDFSQRDTDDDATQTTLFTPGLDLFFDTHNRLAIDLDMNVPNAEGAPTEYGIRTQFQMLI